MTKSRPTLAALAASLLLSSAAFAADKAHREEGPHEHGHGRLAIVLEGTKLEIELEVPGADIVGFEHEAKSAEDKAKLAAATKSVENVLVLFKMPDAAGCTVETVDVKSGTEEHEDHNNHDKNAKGDHDAETEHGEHSEFHAHYALTCKTPEQLTSIEATYFKAFPSAQALKVTVATSKGQTESELTRDKPTLDLGGVI